MNAASTPNFGALLDKPASEVERPKPAPVGTYATTIQGLPRFDKSTKKQTEYVEFTHKFIQAMDDVDEEALTAYLTSPDGSKRNLSDVTMKNTYYLTENSLWRLKDFLKHCGFDVDSGEDSLRQMIEETPGKQVGVYITHTASANGESVFANIDKTLELE